MELIANAMSVPSTRGGGQHGHLALVLPPLELNLVAPEPFIEPQHPGPPPEHAANATNAQMHAADTAYARAITDFNTYRNTRNALRAQILATVHQDYSNILSHPLFGYANITPLDLIEHLTATYGTITAKDLERNRDQLKEPWNPNDDIITLWTRAKNCQYFARNSTESITDNTIMLLLLDALTASGVMTQYSNEWKRRYLCTLPIRPILTSEHSSNGGPTAQQSSR